MSAVAIVPMFNERATCARVVSALRASGRFREVLAVDDGSTDGCAQEAHQAGARVLVIAKNGGKGQAMRRALNHVNDPWIGFFDADLLGFGPEHVHPFFDGAAKGYDMICGLRDRGPLVVPLEYALPLITGERLIRREVLWEVPESCWRGYAVETGINATVDRLGGRTLLFTMRGVMIRTKSDKGGLLQGMMGEAKMWQRISQAKEALRCSRGHAC